ncbi:hypothetical protein [Chryseobacterium tagetis]|uniref:hypothetical protein n=1 Tax=Chryseobacterium tagetis TaxID=2801334 RepID=UPI001CE36E82|nr:hypothetical protein [Chryseobacterium tagetis]
MWSITGNLDYSNTDGLKLISGNASLVENEAGLQIDSANPNSNVLVPQGLYLVLIDLKLQNINEYGRVEIHTGTGQTLNNKIYEIYYRVNLTGSAFMYNFTQDTYLHCGVSYFAYNSNNLYTQMPYYTPPPFVAEPFILNIRLIRLTYN